MNERDKYRRTYRDSKLFVANMDALADENHPYHQDEWWSIFNAFYPALKAWYGNMRLNSNVDRAEIASLAIERAWLYRHKYVQTDSKFHSWMLRVGYNVMIDYVNSLRKNTTDIYDENGQNQEFLTNIDSEIDAGIIFKYLDRNCPKRLVRPFILREVHNKSDKEIAQILGCPESAVSLRISRSKKYIKEQLINLFDYD